MRFRPPRGAPSEFSAMEPMEPMGPCTFSAESCQTSRMNPDISNHTRNGKIAHFPPAVREKLNLRLADGERSRSLVQWLNSLPEVRECLATYFDGRPINDVNLSAWK